MITLSKTDQLEFMWQRVMDGGAWRYGDESGLPQTLSLESVFDSILEDGTSEQITNLVSAACNPLWCGSLELKAIMGDQVSKLVEQHYYAITNYEFVTTYSDDYAA